MHHLYAHRHGKGFEFIFESPAQVAMCGSAEIVKLLAVEDPDGRYYAWRDRTGRYPIVFAGLNSLDMCFPHGVRFAASRGEGTVVRLRLEPVETPDGS